MLSTENVMPYHIKRWAKNNIDTLAFDDSHEVHPSTAPVYTPLVGSQGGVCRYWATDSSSNSWAIRCLCCGSCDWSLSPLEDSQVDRENPESQNQVLCGRLIINNLLHVSSDWFSLLMHNFKAFHSYQNAIDLWTLRLFLESWIWKNYSVYQQYFIYLTQIWHYVKAIKSLTIEILPVCLKLAFQTQSVLGRIDLLNTV